MTGVRTRYGSAAIASLPDGSSAVHWDGHTYWHHDNDWYYPHWDDDDIWYMPAYPPVGWYYPSVPYDADPIILDGAPYYASDGVYYQPTTQDGQEGYAVVEPPAQAVIESTVPNAPNPYDVLRSGLEFIANQEYVSLSVSDTFDELTEDNRKVSSSSWREALVHRPNQALFKYRGDGTNRQIILDGSTVTVISLTKNAYGQAPMPATIDEALKQIAVDYGFEVPAADLLRTDLYDRLFPNIQTGQYLGKELIAGREAHHLGFTQEDKDWEAWIETGVEPRLRKVSIAYKTVEGRPRYTMLINRFDTAVIPASRLQSSIPPGAQKVDLPTPGTSDNDASDKSKAGPDPSAVQVP